jgi:hypothetical protein
MCEPSRRGLANNSKKYANSRIPIDFKDRKSCHALSVLVN